MQLKTDQLRAYDKDCIGCINNKSDIMISAIKKEKDKDEFVDIFLTQDAAERFHAELGKRLHSNKKLLKKNGKYVHKVCGQIIVRNKDKRPFCKVCNVEWLDSGESL